MTPDLADVLKSRPQFHRLADIHGELDESLTSWAAQFEVLYAMQTLVSAGMKTLETGCGYSTVMFALCGSEHFCVTPARGETERVTTFCAEQNISTSSVHALIGNSQEVLPQLHTSLRLDLAFIDGGHFFPIPCIDWFYIDRHLRPGGTLVVDDIRIPTVRMLYDFLAADTNWRLSQCIQDTAFFTKEQDAPNLHDWIEQNYNASYPDWSFLPVGERARRGVLRRIHESRGKLRGLKRIFGSSQKR